MSLRKQEFLDNTINSEEGNKEESMHLTAQDQLPTKVANVAREELRKYTQCKRVGNYLLGKTVGEGSFAKVKEALHILTGEKVAIKIIDKNRARKDRYVSKNMRREARLLQMIRHPHIVQLLEIVETSQCYYLVFEFADGGDLMDYICKRKKLEEEEVRKFIRQIISAVEYLHRLGIMHRDLKIENLLLDANKNIKIIDFGLSNTIYSPDPNNENHCSTQCGSPAYAAPELLVRKDYGPKIDVWSIGVNLYAMLTGRLPYTVDPFNINTLYNKMLKKQMNVVPDYLSEACKDMINQLLNPNPKERFNILEAARHQWITGGQKDPLKLISCPNYLCEEDLDDRILDHVECQLKLNSDDIIRDVIQNRATKNSCVYHLMVRRLNRYKRESLNHKAPPPRPTMENKTRDTKQYTETLSNLSLSTQQNGFVQDQRTPGKTHIMENPFKTIKVALIRQKKASNNAKTAKVPPTSQQDQKSTTRGEAAEKPKLCQVKRVALIKISPARPRFRGISSSSRSITNSPKPGRRKSYFEGLQHRRKSPKVRRRHAEPDDSLSSVGSNSRRRDSLLVKKPSHHDVRGRSESKQNHELGSPGEKNERISENDTENKNFTEELPCGQANTPIISTKDGKAPSTVTHLYTDKGVVLKRNPPETNGKIESKAETILEQDHVQHHVFHSNSKEIIEKAKETTEAIMETTGTIMDAKGTIMDTKVTIKETTGNAKQTTGIMKEKGRITKESAVNAKESNQNAKENTGNTKDTRETQKHQGNKGVIMRNPEGTFEKTEQSIRLVNAKISSIPTKKDVERLEPISPQLNSSGSPTSQRTPEREPSPKGACSQRKPDEKVVTFKRASTKYLNPSKIPVLAGKYSPDQQNPRSPGRLSPRIPSMSSSSPKPLRTIPRKNDVSTLTDKYNKCFSVVVVNSSSNNTALNRVKKSGGNETKAKTEKNETVEKKNNEIDTRAVPVKTSTSVLSPPTRSNSEESPSPKLSTRSSEKGSLVKGSITSKDLKRDSQARQRVEVNENGKLPSVGESSKNQFQTSSPTKEAKQRQSWTGDERRKISNYKKTNDTQQMKSVRREVRTPGTSYRNRTFRPSS